MTSIQQRAELQRRIWQIANDVRGAVDGWDFKQYVLGALFYRFISCRIPDDCIDSKRYPLFMAREVMRQLIDNLCVTTVVQPGASS